MRINISKSGSRFLSNQDQKSERYWEQNQDQDQQDFEQSASRYCTVSKVLCNQDQDQRNIAYTGSRHRAIRIKISQISNIVAYLIAFLNFNLPILCLQSVDERYFAHLVKRSTGLTKCPLCKEGCGLHLGLLLLGFADDLLEVGLP